MNSNENDNFDITMIKDSEGNLLAISETNKLSKIAIKQLVKDGRNIDKQSCLYKFNQVSQDIKQMVIIDALNDCEYYFDHHLTTNYVIFSYLEPDNTYKGIPFAITKSGEIKF